MSDKVEAGQVWVEGNTEREVVNVGTEGVVTVQPRYPYADTEYHWSWDAWNARAVSWKLKNPPPPSPADAVIAAARKVRDNADPVGSARPTLPVHTILLLNLNQALTAYDAATHP